jgi:hypothetical protein
VVAALLLLLLLLLLHRWLARHRLRSRLAVGN